MSERESPDPRTRPDDPAGTKPKVDNASLLPAVREPLVVPPAPPEPPDADAEVLDPSADEDLLPGRPLEPDPFTEAPHVPRFQFLLGALFALGIAAIAVVVLLAVNGTPEKQPEPAWSAWKPTSENPTAEIAQYVAQRYQHEGGKQLVNVKGGPLQIEETPLDLVVDTGLNYFPIDGKGVLFNLCGIGAADCRISEGKPSQERALLLKREIVELALYTFRYTDADNVVAVMPLTANAKGKFAKRQNQAIFLQRPDVEPQLERPLDATLTDESPELGTIGDSPDTVFINSLTSQRSFRFKLQAAGVDGAYMVLEPLPSA